MTLVAIEGIDRLGKSTLIEGLKTVYTDALYTKEPNNYHYTLNICKDSDPYQKLLAFMEDRYLHNKEFLIPNKDKLIFCDRYMLSTIFYQSAQMSTYEFFSEYRMELTKLIDAMHLNDYFIRPNLTIILYTYFDETVNKRLFDSVNNSIPEYYRLKSLNDDFASVYNYININRYEHYQRICVDGKSKQDILNEACDILHKYNIYESESND